MPRKVTTATPTAFGIWLRAARSSHGLTMEALADKASTAAPVISNLERGTRNASRDMVTRLAAALAGPDADERTARALMNEGLKAAGFTPQRRAVQDADAEPPEHFADWPQELKEALAYTQEMDRETQVYIYGLWRKQAHAHYDVLQRTQQAEAALIERQKRLDALKGKPE